MKKSGFNIEEHNHAGRATSSTSKSFKRGVQKGSEGLKSLGRSLKFGVSRAVFSEDLKVSERKIFDPQDKFLQSWNRLFVISCILAVSVDPLFFYLPFLRPTCLDIDHDLAKVATALRTAIDAFYVIHMVFQFRTAYIAPSSRVFGRGELVIDPAQIAKRYLRGLFIVDLLSVLPLPQGYQRVRQGNQQAYLRNQAFAPLADRLPQLVRRGRRPFPSISDHDVETPHWASTDEAQYATSTGPRPCSIYVAPNFQPWAQADQAQGREHHAFRPIPNGHTHQNFRRH
ncbi:hypothetical protein IFM89_018830 [Coptis chinensis]|uniref:Ion transport domain-containing protein n=1 Tax=Coptis chinensis TaxID=261450 RepID=A0A835GYC5_9MAGN|nr:hypothetical protein IFM89_018830 [Coptis chinensis]